MRTLALLLSVILCATAAQAQQPPDPGPDKPAAPAPKPPKKPAPEPPKQPTPKPPAKPGPKPAKKPAPRPTLALTGAIVLSGEGKPALRDAVILIAGGKILAIGTADKLPVPEGTPSVDLTGKFVIPGLIDANSRLFLPEAHELGGRTASGRIADALDLYDRRAADALAQGVTAVHVMPRGTAIAGQGAIVKLTGASDGPRGRIVSPLATLSATYVRSQGSAVNPGSYLAAHDRLEGQLEAAETYKEGWDKYNTKLERYRKELAAWEKKMAAWKQAQAKQDAPKKDAPKKGAPEKDAPKKDAPKKDAPEKDAPKKDAPEKDAPKKDAPKKDAPKKDASKKDASKKDASKKDASKKDASKKDASKKDASKKDAPKKPAPAKKPTPAPKKPSEPKKPRENPELEPLRRVLAGEQRLVLAVDARADIRSAIGLAERFKIKLTLTPAPEAYLEAAALAKGKHAVLLPPPAGRDVRSVAGLRQQRRAAALLTGAGVPVGISSSGSHPAESKWLRAFALRAVASGLPTLRALGTISAGAAEALGDASLGRLGPGKPADLVVLSGHWTQPTAVVERVYVDGELAYTAPKTDK